MLGPVFIEVTTFLMLLGLLVAVLGVIGWPYLVKVWR